MMMCPGALAIMNKLEDVFKHKKMPAEKWAETCRNARGTATLGNATIRHNTPEDAHMAGCRWMGRPDFMVANRRELVADWSHHAMLDIQWRKNPTVRHRHVLKDSDPGETVKRCRMFVAEGNNREACPLDDTTFCPLCCR